MGKNVRLLSTVDFAFVSRAREISRGFCLVLFCFSSTKLFISVFHDVNTACNKYSFWNKVLKYRFLSVYERAIINFL
jgi:hypothetical protein